MSHKFYPLKTTVEQLQINYIVAKFFQKTIK